MKINEVRCMIGKGLVIMFLTIFIASAAYVFWLAGQQIYHEQQAVFVSGKCYTLDKGNPFYAESTIIKVTDVKDNYMRYKYYLGSFQEWEAAHHADRMNSTYGGMFTPITCPQVAVAKNN